MATAFELLASVPLWIAGTVCFDAVHYVLHLLLRSRFRLLRALARPHAVHHRFLDRELRIHWESQRANVFCHLVPEYLTQLVFSAIAWLLLPTATVVGCVLLQTLVFCVLLHYRGLDLNHRPIEVLDAHRPSFLCPPEYHALHHVHPDAHYAAYNKLVDWAVGGGTQLAGRRFAVVGSAQPFGRALCEGLVAAGAEEVLDVSDPLRVPWHDLDVLVVADPGADAPRWVEAFVAAVGARQLPPEVWALHDTGPLARARHYQRDVRVSYRLLWLPRGATDPVRAARTALFYVRRGLHFVPTRSGLAAVAAWLRFRRTPPEAPAGVARVRHRAALAD